MAIKLYLRSMAVSALGQPNVGSKVRAKSTATAGGPECHWANRRASVWMGLLLFACSSMAFQQPSFAEEPVPIKTRAMEGFSEPAITVHLGAAQSGIIKSIDVREGQLVRKGDIVCQLDASVLEAALLSAKAKAASRGKLNAAQASLDNRAHMLEQMKQLQREQHASEKEVRQAQLEFDLAKTSLESARDELLSHEADVQRIEAEIEQRIIRSPIDGIVIEIPHEVGEMVSLSDAQVAIVSQLRRLRVRYFLPTQVALSMQADTQHQVHFPDTKQTALGQVDFVSPVTDSGSGTVRVELIIDNEQGEYRSGLRCVLGKQDHGRTAEFSDPRDRTTTAR